MSCNKCGGTCGCKDGDRGPRGDQGLKGDTGISGQIGETGPQGPQGLQGIQGTQGAQGPQGVPGANGINVTGPVGPTGAQGLTGIQGLQGNPGLNGANGANGLNGQGRLNYIVDTSAIPSTNSPVVNTGIIMKNTSFVIVQLPNMPSIGDVIQVVGTSIGTGGWKIEADPLDKIQLTGQIPGTFITSLGGTVQPSSTNYRDVITMMYDGAGTWLIINKIFADNIIPLFL